MIGEDELKQSLQCSMRPDVGIANDYRCDADIAMKGARLGIAEGSCIITSRQSVNCRCIFIFLSCDAISLS